MRITVPEQIMRLTVPTCTPSRDKPLVIVSSLELGGAGLHIFVSVVAVLLVGCLRDSLQEHHRPTDLAQAVGAGCSCKEVDCLGRTTLKSICENVENLKKSFNCKCQLKS